MKIVCITFSRSNDIQSPDEWHKRLSIFIGAWEILALEHKITRIELVKFNGGEKRNGIEYIFFDPGTDKILFPWSLYLKVKSLKPDIVFVAGLHFPLQVLQLRILLPGSIKIIAQHHAEKPFHGIKKWLQRFADPCIEVYFFASKFIAQNWVQNGNICSIEKVREIMEVSSVFSGLSNGEFVRQATSAPPVFLFVGRLNTNKDPLVVLRAFYRLIKNYPSARLIMIFQSNELLSQIKKMTESYKDAVLLAGKIPHEDMAAWYQKATFIISGSQYEGSGTAVCEAMSMGCIPILPGIDSFLGITNKGACGFLYKPGNEDSLVDIIKQALRADFQEERKKAILQFQNELSFTAIARKIQAVLDSLKSLKMESA